MFKSDYFQRYLDLDWTKTSQIFFLVGIFLISRIPLLNIGFGSDPDSWRIANSAFDLKNFFYYEPSRFPGYPLPEYTNSLIIHYGWLATNTLTMLLSLISVIIFAKVLNELKIKNKGLIVITYAFFPILWINSASTMDYMWALSFIIISWYLIIKKKYLLAGLMMGLAIASRPTSLFAIIPFVYLIYNDSDEHKKIFLFLFTGLMTSIIFFMPLYLKFGLNFITFYPNSPTASLLWTNASYYLGSLAILFLITVLILNYRNLYQQIFTANEKGSKFLFIAVISFLIPFVMAPYEMAYIIPAIPFGLVLINKILKKNSFVILCILILLPSFVSVAVPDDGSIIDSGLIQKDWDLRNDIVFLSEKIIHSNITNSAVISSEYLPIISYLYESSQKNPKKIGMLGYGKYESNEHFNSEKNVLFLYLASHEELNYLRNKGYTVYYIGNVALEMTKEEFGYDLNEYNSSNIIKKF